MSRTQIGFVGCGGIAARHIGNLLGFQDVRIAAVADPVLDRARSAADRAAARAYEDFETMLDSEKLDAIYICVPPFAHGNPERRAIDTGLPFFVEKPLATDFQTADDIARRIEASGIVTAVGYHWRYLNTTEQVASRLAQNPVRLAVGYWLDRTPPPAWWIKDRQSGGQIVEQATHIVDLARILVGEITEVFCLSSRTERPDYPQADIFDVSTATLRFSNGAVGSISSTCLLRWPHRIGLHLFADGLAVELSEHDVIIDTGSGRPVQLAEGDPFVREDRDFIDAVRGRSNRIRCPYGEAMRTHAVTTAMVRSASEGRPVTL